METMNAEALDFLRRLDVAVLASLDVDGQLICAPIHYAMDDSNNLIFKSRATSAHVRGFSRFSQAAVCMYRHDSSFNCKAGLQLKGEIHRITSEADMHRAVEIYSLRFIGARAKFDPILTLISDDAPSTLFRFIPNFYKMTDNWVGRLDDSYLRWSF